MKKGGLVLLTFVFVILFSLLSISAATNATDEQTKVDKAYACLSDKVSSSCSSLSTEEKIFSLLSINSCQTELMSASTNSGECWSNTVGGTCKIKTTAEAILALDNQGADSNKAQAWLLTQNKTPSELSWYLEIEADSATACKISYAGISSTVNIGDDKKISSNAGSCLTLAQDDYWFRVSPSCYKEEFTISCDQSFLTGLLFQKTGSSTVHVFDEASSAGANGVATEQVQSSCFADGGSCSYEGTLWGALVLDSLGKDVSSYLPYLITLEEDNRRFLPESFLFQITADSDQRTSLLSKQKSNKYWSESGDKLYDTALALYPFQQETLQEKTNSKQWLLTTQDAAGCWENSVRNTAFILASIWPKDFSGTGGSGGLPDCQSSGYFCSSSVSCGGSTLSEFDCPSLFVCCSTRPVEKTCSELGGILCSSGQVCQGGDSISSPDASFSQTCCVSGGSCVVSSGSSGSGGEASECELSGGICRTTSCNSNEQSSSASCTGTSSFSSDTCCIQSSQTPKNHTWLWVFLILIVLVVLGIVFRNHLRHFLFKIKDSLGKSSNSGSGSPPPYRPSPVYTPIRRFFPTERRVMVPSQSRPVPRVKSGAQKELDEVLKKLKDMSS